MSQYQSIMGPEVKVNSNETKPGDNKPADVSTSKTESSSKNESTSQTESTSKTEKSSQKAESTDQTEPKIEASADVFSQSDVVEESEPKTDNCPENSTNKTESGDSNNDANELRRRRIQALSQSQ